MPDEITHPKSASFHCHKLCRSVHWLNVNCLYPHPWNRSRKLPDTLLSSRSTHRSVVRCFWQFSWKTPNAAVTNRIRPPKVFVALCCAVTCSTLQIGSEPIKNREQWQAYFLSNKRRDWPWFCSITLGIAATVVSGRVFDGQPTHKVEGIDSFYGTVSVQSPVREQTLDKDTTQEGKKLPPWSEERHQDGYNLDQPGVIVLILIITQACISKETYFQIIHQFNEEKHK